MWCDIGPPGRRSVEAQPTSCRHLTGRGRSDIRRKKPFEAGDVAMLGRGAEGCEQTSLIGHIRGRSPTGGYMLASAGYELPRVGFLKSKDGRDVTVCVIERFPEHVGGSFRRRELLQEHENRTL